MAAMARGFSSGTCGRVIQANLQDRDGAAICYPPRSDAARMKNSARLSADSGAHSSRNIERAQGCFTTDNGINGGYHPVHHDRQTAAGGCGDLHHLNVIGSRTSMFHSRNFGSPRAVQQSSLSLDFAQFVSEVWMEKRIAAKHFELALEDKPRQLKVLLEYARFTWECLRDVDKTESLFNRALQEYPNDPNAVASYALFLWQSEE